MWRLWQAAWGNMVVGAFSETRWWATGLQIYWSWNGTSDVLDYLCLHEAHYTCGNCCAQDEFGFLSINQHFIGSSWNHSVPSSWSGLLSKSFHLRWVQYMKSNDLSCSTVVCKSLLPVVKYFSSENYAVGLTFIKFSTCFVRQNASGTSGGLILLYHEFNSKTRRKILVSWDHVTRI